MLSSVLERREGFRNGGDDSDHMFPKHGTRPCATVLQETAGGLNAKGKGGFEEDGCDPFKHSVVSLQVEKINLYPLSRNAKSTRLQRSR